MNFLKILGIGFLRIFQSLLNKKASAYIASTKTQLRFGLYFETVASLFAIVYLFADGVGGFNTPTLICSMITGVLFLFELITSLKALKIAPLVLCSMCSLGGGIILPAISGTIFFNEPMHIVQWLGVLLFFLSAYLLSPSDHGKWKLNISAIAVLVYNFLINGILGFIGKYFAIKVKNGNSALFSCLSYAFAAFFFGIAIVIMRKIANFSAAPKEPFNKKLLLLGGIVGMVCASIVYFSTVLSRTIPIVELNTIPNAVCIVGNLIVGVILFKEKITISKLIGVGLSIISTVIIVLF